MTDRPTELLIDELDEPADYCGCCGLPMDEDEDQGETEVFCAHCRPHVLTMGAFEDRTWFAQHRSACPFSAEFEVILDRILHLVSVKTDRPREAADGQG